MSKFIMAIDQGTTGSTVLIVDQGGGLVGKATTEFKQIFPQPGWVEHDPKDIWESVQTSAMHALKQANIAGSEIAAVGITNQRETVLLWDRKTGDPVANAIVWQCRRTTDFCNQLKKQGKDEFIRKRTGLVIDPYFSGSKVRWLLKNVKDANARALRGELAMGTMDTYVLWRLTNGAVHKTDVSNASRTMLMNIHTGNWDPQLLKIFSIPESVLPQIDFSSGVYGQTSGLSFLPDGIPVAGMAGDQQSALFGQACFAVGDAKCTFGTGSFLLMNTGAKAVTSKQKMLTTIAWRLPGQKMTYAIEGGAFICGAAVQWLRDGLGIIKNSSDIEPLAKQVKSCDGVQFVPALTGLGAPHWQPEARGVITGLTRGSTKAHIARATLEAMALQNCDILTAMQKDLGKKMSSVRVDGGAVVNDLLMQLQADYLGLRVSRPKQIETTGMGAAFLAGLGVGFWKSQDQIKKVWQLQHNFESKMSAKDRALRLQEWQMAIQKAGNAPTKRKSGLQAKARSPKRVSKLVPKIRDTRSKK